jgi:tetratricopeptide (TPR) repeat protein
MNSNSLGKQFSYMDLGLVGFGIILWLSACWLNLMQPAPRIELSKQDTALNLNKTFIKFLSAGHRRLFTDLIWVQTLIETDTEHYQKKDLNNWLFLRFDTIADLDPKFYQNYLYGGQFLNIIKDDLEGAKIIYQKGLTQYPDDYNLNFNAGFLYYFEAGDYANGLKYLSQIQDHPRAPFFLKSIIHKLKFEIDGSLEAIYKLVYLNYESTQDPVIKERLRKDLYAIKAELDLNCLNLGKTGCQRTDFDGTPYIYRDGQFSTQKPFSLFRIKSRKDQTKEPEKPVP